MIDEKEFIRRAVDLKRNPDFDRIIRGQISEVMDRSGMFYRCFSRIKSDRSLVDKMQRKGYHEGYLLQDVYGVRIAVYFKDDVDIAVNEMKRRFHINDKDINRIEGTRSEFKAEVLNLVAHFPDEVSLGHLDAFFNDYFIDRTFEIQIRTVFSEGWHEIDHDLRYKCKSDWDRYPEFDHALNGVFATLSMCDWSIIRIFEEMSICNFERNEWDQFLRNRFRIRIVDNLSDETIDKLNRNADLARRLAGYSRSELIHEFINSRMRMPITADNIVRIVEGGQRPKINEEI